MTGLKRSKTKLSEATPLDLHKAVIRAGNPSLEELDWAIDVICSVTRPKINLALSTVKSEVWEVRARLEYARTLQT